jgi:hypothetical protein
MATKSPWQTIELQFRARKISWRWRMTAKTAEFNPHGAPFGRRFS